jgi:hypothetical protein
MQSYTDVTSAERHDDVRPGTGWRATVRALYAGVALLLPLALLVQVFLAGLGVFDGPQAFATHRDVGYTLTVVPIVLAVLGLVARVPRRLTGLAVVIFAQFLLQSVFVAARADAPAFAALHPVNGFVMTILAVELAREAWARRTG